MPCRDPGSLDHSFPPCSPSLPHPHAHRWSDSVVICYKRPMHPSPICSYSIINTPQKAHTLQVMGYWKQTQAPGSPMNLSMKNILSPSTCNTLSVWLFLKAMGICLGDYPWETQTELQCVMFSLCDVLSFCDHSSFLSNDESTCSCINDWMLGKLNIV